MSIVESAINTVILFGLIGTAGAALLVAIAILIIIRVILAPLPRRTI